MVQNYQDNEHWRVQHQQLEVHASSKLSSNLHIMLSCALLTIHGHGNLRDEWYKIKRWIYTCLLCHVFETLSCSPLCLFGLVEWSFYTFGSVFNIWTFSFSFPILQVKIQGKLMKQKRSWSMCYYKIPWIKKWMSWISGWSRKRFHFYKIDNKCLLWNLFF